MDKETANLLVRMLEVAATFLLSMSTVMIVAVLADDIFKAAHWVYRRALCAVYWFNTNLLKL